MPGATWVASALMRLIVLRMVANVPPPPALVNNKFIRVPRTHARVPACIQALDFRLAVRRLANVGPGRHHRRLSRAWTYRVYRRRIIITFHRGRLLDRKSAGAASES